jgi:hypothetical protein
MLVSAYFGSQRLADVKQYVSGQGGNRRWAMAKKIARIEELLGETITEVTLYRTPSGALFKTKEEAITSIIAVACPQGNTEECREYLKQGLRCQDCKIGNFLRDES